MITSEYYTVVFDPQRRRDSLVEIKLPRDPSNVIFTLLSGINIKLENSSHKSDVVLHTGKTAFEKSLKI